MAMFDGDMVTVTTPDGRRIPMPSSLAASFPTLQIQPPAPPVAPPQLAQVTPAPASPSVAPGTQALQPPPPSTPDAQPAPAATEPPRDAPVTRPGDEQGSQTVAPEPRKVWTNKELAAAGPAGVLEEQNKAIDDEQSAIDREAKLQADQATRVGNRLAQRDAQTQAILEERARVAQENAAELDRRMAERDAMAAEIAKTKIDRSVDHPIWSAIGLILSTIGTAMKTRPGDKWENPAYDTLMQQIDRKVDAQMKDLDLKRASLAQMNVGITEQRQRGMDRLSEIDVRRDAALRQAEQVADTMAQQFKSPLAFAQAQKLKAQLRMTRAGLAGQASERIQAQQNADRAASFQERGQAIQLRGQNMEQARFEQQLAATEREKMAAISAQLLAGKEKATAERAKQVREAGIADPRTGLPMLNPEGQARVAQADQLEARARKDPGAAGMAAIQEMKKQASTPEELDQLKAVEARVRMDPQIGAQIARQYAKSIKDDALVNNAEVARDATAAGKLSEELASAQALAVHIGDVTDKLKAGPSAFNREEWSGIKTELSHIAGRYMNALGERPSVKAFEQTVKHIENYDPDSIFDRAASREKVIESLNQLKKMISVNTDASLKANKIRSGWTPKSLGEGAIGFNASEKTAKETGDEEKGSWLNEATARTLSLGTKSWEDFGFGKEKADEAASRPGSEAGLSPNVTFRLKAMVKRADQAGDAERGQIVDALRAPIEAGLQDGGRDSLAYGMLQVIKGQDPQLYSEVVGGLSDIAQDTVKKAGIGDISTTANIPGRLSPSGFNPDRQAEATREREAREQDAAIAAYVKEHPIKGKPDIEALLRFINRSGSGDSPK